MLAQFINLILPPRCWNCHEFLQEKSGLCPSCWSNLKFTTKATCCSCGQELPTPSATPCPPCALQGAALIPYRWNVSLCHYDDNSKPLLLKLKHGDAPHLATFWGISLAQKIADRIEGNELLVPVPLHWSRLLRRQYNQAAMLAYVIGKSLRLPVGADVLCRRRRTKDQGQFSRDGRHQNVSNAFSLNPNWQEHIVNRAVILVDDVFTTGATAAACSTTLLAAGATTVAIVTVATVMHHR